MSAGTRQILFQIILLSLLLLTGGVSAQEAQRPSLHTYGCDFIEDPGQVQIRLAMANRSGQPLEPSEVRVRDVGGERDVPAESVDLQRAEARLPARVMFVVDTTLNYHSEAMRTALENSILGSPFLFANDEVGLVKFDVAASQLGPPMLDKGALFNAQGDKLEALREQEEGTAVLYDGILAALDNATDPARQRLIVVVLSDSTQSAGQSPTSIDQVIARANEVKAQIFPLMFVNIQPHVPDLNAARQLANSTGGFFWVYGDQAGDDKRPDPFAAAMTEYLTQADAALNTEYILTVPATELTPDASQVAGVGITVVSGSEVFDLGTVNCNVLFGNHTIAFAPISDAERLIELGESLTVGFQIDPPPFEGETLTLNLWFNGESLLEAAPVDSTSDISLESLTEAELLEALEVGGENTLKVELLRGEEILSEATVSGIRLQQRLTLTCGTGDTATCADLSGPMTLNATLEGGAPLPPGEVVHFQMRAAEGDYQVLNQSGSIALTTAEGAVFPVEQINDKITELFGEDAENVEAIAFIGDSLEDATFISDPVAITLAEIVVATEAAPTEESPVVVATEQVVPVDVPPVTVPMSPLIVPLAVTGVLILIDLILLRRIRVARVKRLMRFPDNYDLPGTPMKITVRRNGQSQMHVLAKRTMNLGRGSSNDINLPDDTNVSREHGIVMWRRGQWLYANRKPETGVSIDQKKVKGLRTRPLRDGTQIQIGDYHMVCHYDMDADPDSLLQTQFGR